MSLNEEVELLRNIPMFSKLEPSKLKLLAFTSERLSFDDDTILFEQGAVGDSAYIIVKGEVDVIVNSPSGPLTVAKLSKNSLFGEMAILCDMPRTATIRASGPLTALRISKELFFRLGTEFPEMAFEVMREIALRLEQTTSDLQQTKAELAEVKTQLAALRDEFEALKSKA